VTFFAFFVKKWPSESFRSIKNFGAFSPLDKVQVLFFGEVFFHLDSNPNPQAKMNPNQSGSGLAAKVLVMRWNAAEHNLIGADPGTGTHLRTAETRLASSSLPCILLRPKSIR
jgi:hypothetical protein